MSDDVVGEGTYCGGDEYLFTCAECGKRKLYWNTSKGIGWCHPCQRVIYKSPLDDDDVLFSRREVLDFPTMTSQTQVTYSLAWRNREAADYLRSRGVTDFMAVSAGLLYDEEKKRILYPIHSPDKTIPPSYMTRGIRKSDGWRTEATNKSVYCFGCEHVEKERPRNIIMVEGIFDILSPGWLGHGIALLGTSLYETILCWLLQWKPKVLVWLDPDEPGRRASARIVKDLRLAGLDAVVIPAQAEPGDLSRGDRQLGRVSRILES